MAEPGFLDYISSFDICCLIETFTHDDFDFSSLSDNNVIFHAPAVRLSRFGRRSGGAVLLVKKLLAPHVTRVKCTHDSMVILRVCNYFNTDFIVICAYVPPIDSPYYSNREVKCNIFLLEEELLRLHEEHPRAAILICGDFNARTGEWNIHADLEDAVDSDNEGVGLEDCYCPINAAHRNSQDPTINQFGRNLISLCKIYHLCILNGSTRGDNHGNLTYFSQRGNSVLDYALLYANEFSFSVTFTVGAKILSSHMPLEIAIGAVSLPQISSSVSISKLVWTDQKADEVKQNLQSAEFRSGIKSAGQMLDHDIDGAVRCFTQVLLSNAQCMQCTIKSGSHRARCPKWFDIECQHAKRDASRALFQARRSGSASDRKLYVEHRNKYKNLIKEKKKMYNKDVCQNLITNVRNSRAFWPIVRQVMNRRSTNCSITLEEWKTYFQNLFRSPRTSDLVEASFVVQHEELDGPIREEEVKWALAKLRHRKAAGVDDIPGDYLKFAGGHISTFLVSLFNDLYDKQYFPQDWCKSLIIPLHKGGDRTDPKNYRGISLLCSISKVFMSILTNRLREWAEESNQFCLEQAGFRADHSTIDHVYTLFSIAVKHVYGSGRGKLYAAFVDYRKAFDSVDRAQLWTVLAESGLSTKFLRMLKSIYSQVQACVRWNGAASDFFDCSVGVRQGAVESPIIFCLFINYVAMYIRRHGRHGIQLLPGYSEIFSLIFADDVVLLSTTSVGLQRQIDNLYEASERLGLHINIDKTKVMVFRRGGFLGKCERWSLGGRDLEVVNQYKYLGFVFTTKLSITSALENLSVKAKTKTVQLMKSMWHIHTTNGSVFFRLYDAQVKPALLYGSELWGLERRGAIEKAHMFACKQFLNVSIRTPNTMCSGELGRYPMYINTTVRAVRYWLRLCRMSVERLPKQAYLMTLKEATNIKLNWAKAVEQSLSRLGFGYVWLSDGRVNENSFIRLLKRRLQDCYQQEWHTKINESDRFALYSSVKREFHFESYLHDVNIKKFRDTFIRFRLGNIALGANLRISLNDEDRECPFCKVYEDEQHFIFHCHKYVEIRQKYISKYLDQSGFTNVAKLLNGRGIRKTRDVAMYIFYAYKQRCEALAHHQQ